VRPMKPWLDGLPRIVFVTDMGDSFTASLPLATLAHELPIMATSPHRYLFLSKRPDRMRQFMREARATEERVVWDVHHQRPGSAAAGATPSPDRAALRLVRAGAGSCRLVALAPIPRLADRWWTHREGFPGAPPGATWPGEHRSAVRGCEDSGRLPGSRGRIPADLWVRQMPSV
jgi:hypothetical protein